MALAAVTLVGVIGYTLLSDILANFLKSITLKVLNIPVHAADTILAPPTVPPERLHNVLHALCNIYRAKGKPIPEKIASSC